jgi:hypothetical protein
MIAAAADDFSARRFLPAAPTLIWVLAAAAIPSLLVVHRFICRKIFRFRRPKTTKEIKFRSEKTLAHFPCILSLCRVEETV